MQLINIDDYEKKAKIVMPRKYFDFYQGGSGDEITLKENQEAFKRIYLRPRVLVDVSKIDISCTVLGEKIDTPIMIAPSAVHKLANRYGEIATAKGAKDVGTIMVVSTLSSFSIEEIAKTGCKLWFQLYIYRNDEITKSFVERVERAGYKALVLTVDTPVLGKRERDLKNNFRLSKGIKLANFTGQKWEGKLGGERAPITWETIKKLRSMTKLPIVLKGILIGEDAALAVKSGVDGIIVSNHGGRQLDTSVPTIDALPEVVKAVDGKCEVYLDSGIRRGTDVVKALALGAKAVLIGRPALWGLAVEGESGVKNVLEILSNELETSMKLLGCRFLKEINKRSVS